MSDATNQESIVVVISVTNGETTRILSRTEIPYEDWWGEP